MNDVTSEIIESAKSDYENEGVGFGTLVKRYGKYKIFWSRKAKTEKWVKKAKITSVTPNVTPNASVTPKNESTTSSFDGILSTVAVRKIKEITQELGEHYSPIDEPVLVVYAKSYEYFIKLTKMLDEEEISLVSPKTGSKYTNPNFNSWLAVGKNIASIGEKIGITASARKKIGITLGGDDKTESLFDFVEKMLDEDIDV